MCHYYTLKSAFNTTSIYFPTVINMSNQRTASEEMKHIHDRLQEMEHEEGLLHRGLLQPQLKRERRPSLFNKTRSPAAEQNNVAPAVPQIKK